MRNLLNPCLQTGGGGTFGEKNLNMLKDDVLTLKCECGADDSSQLQKSSEKCPSFSLESIIILTHILQKLSDSSGNMKSQMKTALKL